MPIIKTNAPIGLHRLSVLVLLAVLLLSACTSADVNVTDVVPTRTVEPTVKVVPTTTSAPETSPTPTNEPSATPPSTQAPTTEVTGEPTTAPEGDVILPENVTNLQATESFASQGASFMEWMPDSQALALAGETNVIVQEIEPVETIANLESGGYISSLATSPDQRMLAWALQEEPGLFLLDMSAGDSEPLQLPASTQMISLAFAPGGGILAASGLDNTIHMYDTSTGEEIDAWQFPSPITNLAYSPDGARLGGVEGMEFRVHIWDAQSGAELNQLLWQEHASPVLYGAFFSPTWETIAWVARGTVLIMDVESGSILSTLNHEDFVSTQAWSPDGKIFATAAGATVGGTFSPVVILWDPMTGEQLQVLVYEQPPYKVTFSPDGTQLAMLLATGEVQILAVAP